jgi:hypothetical protein
MKKYGIVLLGSIVFLMVFSMISASNVLAAGETDVPVNGDYIETQVEANNRVMFTFRERTRLTIKANVDLEVNINCDALRIGVKYFEMEMNCTGDCLMNMTCTEEQLELGLQKGYAYQIRERHRYTYQEGFCAYIQCNCSCEAKLKIQANNQNRNGNWAFYNEDSEEWVAVPTTVEDGYLVAETDHFSYWTVLIPTNDNNFMIYIGIGVAAIIGLVTAGAVILFKKRK